MNQRTFTKDYKITNFRQKNGITYAHLLDAEGKLTISADFDYILTQLQNAKLLKNYEQPPTLSF